MYENTVIMAVFFCAGFFPENKCGMSYAVTEAIKQCIHTDVSMSFGAINGGM